MDSSLVQLITELVMAELQQAGGTVPPTPAPSGPAAPAAQPVGASPNRSAARRKVLLCAVPAAKDSLAPVWESLKTVEGVSWITVRGCTRAEPIDVPLPGVKWVEPPSVWDDLVNSVEAVILPALPLEVVSKLSLLIPDVPAVAAALQGVMQGRPVWAASLEVDKLRRSSGRLPGGFQSAYFQHLRAMESLGIQVLQPLELARKLQGGAARAQLATSSSRGRDVLTVEDLEAALQAGQKSLSLAPGTIVTPLAREKAKTMGIEVHYA